MFGFGEEYTKGKYDEAVEEEQDIKKSPRPAEGVVMKNNPDWLDQALGILPEDREWYDMRLANAHKRVEKLYGKSEKEATALNEEYEDLLSRVSRGIESARALAVFEKEKLGMHKDDEDKK